MSAFTEDEIEYLGDQSLGRLATVGPNGQPHVVPVGFTYHADGDTVRISGHDFNETKKFKDAENHPKVAQSSCSSVSQRQKSQEEDSRTTRF